jgi:hypothetical protein
MGAYEELRSTGRLGPAGALLLYKVVQVVARARNFPPPQGHVQWDRDAAADAAHDFLDGARGRKRLADLAARAVDEESFERLLHAAVLNFHRDQSRRSDMGAMILRIGDILERSELFATVGGQPARWHLPGVPAEPSTVPPTQLATAVNAEPNVTVPRWQSSRRRAPQADFDTFERLIGRVLAAAAGSLTASQIAEAIASRLDPRRSPLTVELDVLERLPDPSLDARTEDEVVGRLHAADVFARLSDREKILLATWERPVRDLGEVLGVARSQATVLRQRLATVLASELANDEEADVVVQQLVGLANDWLRQRTNGPGTAFVISDGR